MSTVIPVALFAYKRADLLALTLESLRANDVKLIHAFSDGPRNAEDAPLVEHVRATLRGVDWADVRITAHGSNRGLGTSVVAGVTSVLAEHDAVMVCEDDLRLVPGTVAWVTAALEHYASDPRVASVSAWTTPRVTPPNHGTGPHFSRRFGSWFWGTWARAWKGMQEGSATERLQRFAAMGGDPAVYGVDIPMQASVERVKNIWAVRFVAEHLVSQRLSVCPPWTMVEHLGYDAHASNPTNDRTWHAPANRAAPPIPAVWPEPVEDPDVARLYREGALEEARSGRPPSLLRRAVRKLKRLLFGSDATRA